MPIVSRSDISKAVILTVLVLFLFSSSPMNFFPAPIQNVLPHSLVSHADTVLGPTTISSSGNALSNNFYNGRGGSCYTDGQNMSWYIVQNTSSYLAFKSWLSGFGWVPNSDVTAKQFYANGQLYTYCFGSNQVFAVYHDANYSISNYQIDFANFTTHSGGYTIITDNQAIVNLASSSSIGGVVSDSLGHPWIVVSDIGKHDVLIYEKSGTWSLKGNFSNAQINSLFQLIPMNGGKIGLAFTNYAVNQENLEIWTGSTWTAATGSPFSLPSCIESQSLGAIQDKLFLTIGECDGSNNWYSVDLYTYQYGGSISSETILTNMSVAFAYPNVSVSTDNSSTVIISWADEIASAFYISSSDGGSTWGAPMTISNSESVPSILEAEPFFSTYLSAAWWNSGNTLRFSLLSLSSTPPSGTLEVTAHNGCYQETPNGSSTATTLQCSISATAGETIVLGTTQQSVCFNPPCGAPMSTMNNLVVSDNQANSYSNITDYNSPSSNLQLRTFKTTATSSGTILVTTASWHNTNSPYQWEKAMYLFAINGSTSNMTISKGDLAQRINPGGGGLGVCITAYCQSVPSISIPSHRRTVVIAFLNVYGSVNYSPLQALVNGSVNDPIKTSDVYTQFGAEIRSHATFQNYNGSNGVTSTRVVMGGLGGSPSTVPIELALAFYGPLLPPTPILTLSTDATSLHIGHIANLTLTSSQSLSSPYKYEILFNSNSTVLASCMGSSLSTCANSTKSNTVATITFIGELIDTSNSSNILARSNIVTIAWFGSSIAKCNGSAYCVYVRFIKPLANPYATQEPIFYYKNNGSSQYSFITTSFQLFIVDPSSHWTTTAPFFFNNQYWTPSPASGIISANNTYITIKYNSGQGPTQRCLATNDPLQNLFAGCWLDAAILTYGNLISVGWFMSILILEIAGMAYLKTTNVGLAILLFLVGFVLSSLGVNQVTGASTLPGPMQIVGLAFTGLAVTGIIYKFFAGRGG